MYTYYTKVESYEHMLSCTELAVAYGLFTTKADPKPHSRLVAAMLNAYYEEHPEEEKMYYSTKHGMMQVWPAEIYKPILESVIVKHTPNTEQVYVTSKGKYHKYQIAPSLVKIK